MTTDTPPAIDIRPCSTCGHLAEFHRLDDAGPPPTTPGLPFRCTGNGFKGFCDCAALAINGQQVLTR